MKAKILGLLVVGFLGGPGVANASIIVNFRGTCTSVGCPTGTDRATAVITLDDGYVFGSALDASNVVSLAYSSGNFSFFIGPGDFSFIGGSFNLHFGLKAEDVSLFSSSSNGAFFVDDQTRFWGAGTVPPGGASNQGTRFTLTSNAVPEPGTLALLGLGLLGLGFTRRRIAA